MKLTSAAMTVNALLVGIGLAAGGCSSSSESSENSTAPVTCDLPIARFKEMIIVEESVVSDARSRNDIAGVAGPWSFRHAVEGIVPAGTDPSTFVRNWLESWQMTDTLNGFPVEPFDSSHARRESRVVPMMEQLICPWLRQRPANGCDDTCDTCSERVFDLTKAPFRLIAIVNRTDLRTRTDTASIAGESRLVFAMTRGPADDPASANAPMTVIFEYALPTMERTPKEWAQTWHNLGKHAEFDEAFKVELTNLTESFVKRDSWPGRTNGSAIAQVRTNESVFNWVWQLREFRLNSAGALVNATVSNTPGDSLNDSPTLRDWVAQNANAIKQDTHVLPSFMTGGSSNQLLFRWTLSGVEESTRLAFARGTCNGCHSGENPPIDTAFHISPFRKGTEKLSAFVYRQDDPSKDELARREVLMRQQLCP